MVRLLAIALAAAAGWAGATMWSDAQTPPASYEGVQVVRQNDPAEGTPPVVWVSGTLATVEPSRIVVREGSGPEVTMRRFAGDATSFHRPDGETWTQLGGPSIAAAEGQAACVEALLDEGELLALRVFVGAGCSPVP